MNNISLGVRTKVFSKRTLKFSAFHWQSRIMKRMLMAKTRTCGSLGNHYLLDLWAWNAENENFSLKQNKLQSCYFLGSFRSFWRLFGQFQTAIFYDTLAVTGSIQELAVELVIKNCKRRPNSSFFRRYAAEWTIFRWVCALKFSVKGLEVFSISLTVKNNETHADGEDTDMRIIG